MTEYISGSFKKTKGNKETWNVMRECIGGNENNGNEQIQLDGCDR